MPNIPFPNVPAFEGVPPLPRIVNIPPVITIGLGLTESILASASQSPTRWGVFDSSGNQIGIASPSTGFGAAILAAIVGPAGPVLSTNEFEYTKEMQTADFPIEAGGFASYNKVEKPGNPVVTFCLGGSESDRTAFLTAIDTAVKSTNLYSAVTPEATYINQSLDRYRYARRNDKGATMLIVEITMKEIRQISAAYTISTTPITNPQSPSAAPQTNSGNVQPTAPDQSTLKSIYNQFNALMGVQ